jgi:glycosyltransferase involved in cell wall biosynthesis
VRRREPLRRPLNLPRTLFTRRGLTGFHALARGDRAAFLRDALAPSYPRGRVWDAPVEAAARDRRFGVAAEPDGADEIVCATGFLRGYQHDPLLRRLVEEHDAGVWVPAGNAEALAGALSALAANRERVETMGRNARALAEREFGRDEMAERLARTLEEVAG